MKVSILKKESRKSFHYLAGINRPVNPSQVTKLATSINKMGVIRPVVVADISFITGKKQSYIIDGQHLFNALMRNDMDIPFVTIPIKDKKDLVENIALLNASSKNWAMTDYILAWSSLSEDYIKLNRYYQIYDFDVSFVAAILNGLVAEGGNITTKIKKGTFKIVNEKENAKKLDYVTDLLKVIPRMNRTENRYACREYIRFVTTCKSYNHAKFMAGLQRNQEQFVLATHEEGKLMELFNKIK